MRDEKNKNVRRAKLMPKAEYNRLTKRFGKMDPDSVFGSNDLASYRRYMQQRISDCDYFIDRAVKKNDADALNKAAKFAEFRKTLCRMLSESETRLDEYNATGEIYSHSITFDKYGQGTFNFDEIGGSRS